MFDKKLRVGFRLTMIIALFALMISARGQESIPLDLEKSIMHYNQVLSEFNNYYFEKVESQDEVYASIAGMLDTLDPHTIHLPPQFFEDMKTDIQGEFGGLGIEVGMRKDQLTVISPLEDTPAWRAGIQAEDKIVAIEGEPTAGQTLSECVHKMRGKIGTEINISIMRKGWDESKIFTIIRDKIIIRSVRKVEIVDNAIGYARISTFNEHTETDLQKGIKKLVKEVRGKDNLRGFILDLRNNPGGPLKQAVFVADTFISAGTIVSVRGRHTLQNESHYAHQSQTYDGFPMIVLVNGGSASASEIVAGALMDHGRALIMGTKSFGKGSVQTVLGMKDGSGLKLTIAKYYTPSNRSIQEVGIEPDVVVESLSPEQLEILDRHEAERKKRRREASLEGHLINEGQVMEDEIESEYSQEEEKILEEDYQLGRAIETINSWSIFQSNKNSAAQ